MIVHVVLCVGRVCSVLYRPGTLHTDCITLYYHEEYHWR